MLGDAHGAEQGTGLIAPDAMTVRLHLRRIPCDRVAVDVIERLVVGSVMSAGWSAARIVGSRLGVGMAVAG